MSDKGDAVMEDVVEGQGSHQIDADANRTGVYSWKLPNFGQQVDKIYSERFEIGTYLWRLLLFPRGKKANWLSVYLDAPEAPYTPLTMSPKASFKLVAVNHLDPAKNFSKETSHTFTSCEADWGFTLFLPLEKVVDHSHGFVAADGSITLEAHITVHEDEQLKKEAHLYCTIKIATDQDCKEQIGRSRQVGLLDHDLLPDRNVLRLKKQTRFSVVKEMVAERLDVPVHLQRYWTCKRQHGSSMRLHRPLTPGEERRWILSDLKDFRELTLPAQDTLMDVKLYLETLPTPGHPLHPLSPQEVMLFIKVYDPFKEEIKFLMRVYLMKTMKIHELKMVVAKRERLDGDAAPRMLVFEEIRSEPPVLCQHVPDWGTVGSSNLIDGDILIIQVLREGDHRCRFPTVDKYLEYIRNRCIVNLRKLEDPKEPGTSLQMGQEMDYDEVTERIAQHIGLDDPSRLRLTQHNVYSHQPQQAPIKWRGISKLENMLQHANHTNDILYYEVLDRPLQELETLKTLMENLFPGRALLPRPATGLPACKRQRETATPGSQTPKTPSGQVDPQQMFPFLKVWKRALGDVYDGATLKERQMKYVDHVLDDGAPDELRAWLMEDLRALEAHWQSTPEGAALNAARASAGGSQAHLRELHSKASHLLSDLTDALKPLEAFKEQIAGELQHAETQHSKAGDDYNKAMRAAVKPLLEACEGSGIALGQGWAADRQEDNAPAPAAAPPTVSTPAPPSTPVDNVSPELGDRLREVTGRVDEALRRALDRLSLSGSDVGAPVRTNEPGGPSHDGGVDALVPGNN